MVTGEMDPVDHLNGSLLLLCPQKRSCLTTEIMELRVKIPHCQVQMLAIFQSYLAKHPEFALKALHLLVQERELSHLLIAISDARDELLQGRRCVTE